MDELNLMHLHHEYIPVEREQLFYADAPAFTSAPRLGFASISTANTGRDGTGTIADIVTGVAAGTIISEIVLKATGDPADSIVTIFVHDGTSYRLYDEFDLGDPAAASTTVSGFRISRTYDNLILPSSSFKLSGAITVALTAGAINAFAHGGDLT
jgi:hypothetical protein